MCRRSDLELFVSRERIAEDLRVREDFFRDRIDGRFDQAEQIDSADPTRGSDAEILICRDCDILVRRDASPNFESDAYAPFAMERMLRAHIRAYRRKAARYRALLPHGARIVEVGSYVGGFLHVAREWGWDAIGVDVGRDTSHFAQAHGYVTRQGPFEECRFDSQSFDGAFIWNCFEQIPDLQTLIAEVRRILKARGVLVIRVPNAHFYRSTRDLALLGHSNLLGFPHLYGFTVRSLERLLCSFGFTPIDHWTAPHIDPGIRPLSATARQEAARLAPELRRSWIEAAFLHGSAGMPEKATIQRARRDKRQGKAPSTQAGEFVREEMDHIRHGKHGARSTKQAIAIGLSKARRSGVNLAPPKKGSARTRKSAQYALHERGHTASPRRSKAVRGALKREGHSAASRSALSRQAHTAARRRSASSRHNAAVKASRTKGATGRHRAAVKAARTRARHSH